MFIIGITGGIGCGKSEVGKICREYGLQVIDADEISKKVSAGITPERRLQMELDASVARTKALAGPNGIQLPTTMFNGATGNNSSASMLESILGAKILSGEIGNK